MPRPDDQPPDTEPLEEKQARENITIGELWQRERHEERDYAMPEMVFDHRAAVAAIGPERWAELRERRDAILAELRANYDEGGGD
jgi:hypothetical protein